MTTHEQLVFNLCKTGECIIRDLTPHKAELWHMASALQGEAGELFDAIKKHAVYDKDLDLVNVIEELGDIEFYLEGLRQLLEITRDETVKANIKKLTKRYPDGRYSNKHAKERADKE